MVGWTYVIASIGTAKKYDDAGFFSINLLIFADILLEDTHEILRGFLQDMFQVGEVPLILQGSAKMRTPGCVIAAEVVSNSRNIIHKTWPKPFSRSVVQNVDRRN